MQEMRPWVIQTNPSWPFNKVMDEVTRLWGVHRQNIPRARPMPIDTAPPPLPAPRSTQSMDEYKKAQESRQFSLKDAQQQVMLSPSLPELNARIVQERKLEEERLQKEEEERIQQEAKTAKEQALLTEIEANGIESSHIHPDAHRPLPTARGRPTHNKPNVFASVPKVAEPVVLVENAPAVAGPPIPQSFTIISSVPRIADPMLPANVVCDATKTTRGARAALAVASSYGSIIPSNVIGGTKEVDWAGFTRSLPTHLPTNRNEKHLLNAILSVWNTKV